MRPGEEGSGNRFGGKLKKDLKVDGLGGEETLKAGEFIEIPYSTLVANGYRLRLSYRGGVQAEVEFPSWQAVRETFEFA